MHSDDQISISSDQSPDSSSDFDARDGDMGSTDSGISAQCSETTAVQLDSTTHDADSRSRNSRRPVKTFAVRESLLTTMYENFHLRGVRLLLWLFFPCWAVSIVSSDYLNKRPLEIPGLNEIASGTYNPHITFLVWILYHAALLLLFWGFSLWVHIRSKLRSKPRRIFDYFCIGIAVVYLIAFEWIPVWLSFRIDSGTFLKTVLAGEKARMMMKAIAFLQTKSQEIYESDGVRTASADRSFGKISADKDFAQKSPEVKLSAYIYFLFAPTLIYRDHYPRTRKVRWGFVITNIIETIGCCYFGAIIAARYVIPVSRTIASNHPISLSTFCFGLLNTMAVGLPLYFILNHGVLHTLQNIFAELLRFGDRMFYLDWWNQTSMGPYMRTCDVLVQDWLYFYIHQPIRRVTGSKFLGNMAVLMLSGFEHELLIVCGYGFFYPVTFVMFLVFGAWDSLFAVRPSNKYAVANFVFFVMLNIGLAIIFTALPTEYYARLSCNSLTGSLWEIFIPQTWFCSR